MSALAVGEYETAEGLLKMEFDNLVQTAKSGDLASSNSEHNMLISLLQVDCESTFEEISSMVNMQKFLRL